MEYKYSCYNEHGRCSVCNSRMSQMHEEGCEVGSLGRQVYDLSLKLSEKSQIPLRVIEEDVVKTDVRINHLMRIGSQLDYLPFNTNFRGTRYNTDNQIVLHLWTEDGRSFDLRLPKDYFEWNR